MLQLYAPTIQDVVHERKKKLWEEFPESGQNF